MIVPNLMNLTENFLTARCHFLWTHSYLGKALYAAVRDEARFSLIWELIDVELAQKGSRRARWLLPSIPKVDCLFPALTSMDDGILNADLA